MSEDLRELLWVRLTRWEFLKLPIETRRRILKEQVALLSDDKCPDDERKYPCADCGVLRSKNEGGTTFTLCDECWSKRYGTGKEELSNLKAELSNLARSKRND